MRHYRYMVCALLGVQAVLWVFVGCFLSSVVSAQDTKLTSASASSKVAASIDTTEGLPPTYQLQEVIKPTCNHKYCLQPFSSDLTLTDTMQTYGYSTTEVEYSTTEFLYGDPERCPATLGASFSTLEGFASHYRLKDQIGSCGVNAYTKVYREEDKSNLLLLSMSCPTEKGELRVTLSVPETKQETDLGTLTFKEAGERACRYRTIVAERPTEADDWYTWDNLDDHGEDPLTYLDEYLW